jgi:hypothetical protein
MGKLNAKDAGFNVGVNVRVTKRDKQTGRILEKREGHNKCLRMTLLGIAKYLNGEYNPTQPHLYYYDWIPRYLGVGTNVATLDSAIGVSTEVNINDTRLLNEISPRIKLPERNTIINRSNHNYIQLVISTYLPESYYNGQDISEAGLFSKSTGNNCLFRIAFDKIKKTEESVIEINWTISIISVNSANEPYESLDKTDLIKATHQLLDRFVQLYPDIHDACEIMKDAIYEYGSMDSTKASIADMTKQVTNEFNKMKEWLEVIDPIPVIEQVDDINGEIV